MASFPYDDRFPVNRTLPEQGRPRADVLAELRGDGQGGGRVLGDRQGSGTMYCGDHEHYDFMNEAFGLFAHVNALQRDMCPSADPVRGRDHRDDARPVPRRRRHRRREPAGLVTTGGTGSILHAVLAYREQRRDAAASPAPNFVKPETAHPAFDKACHLFGVEVRNAPVDPETTHGRRRGDGRLIDDHTIAIVGSACNYGYGTIDPIAELGELALERGVGLHVDGCLGGLHPPVRRGARLRHPAVRLPRARASPASRPTRTSTATRFKGTLDVLLFRDKALRNGQYFFLTEWTGGKYCSPGIEGSRSGGLLAATWAAMVQLGREGYRRYAEADLRDRRRDEGRGAVAPRAADHGLARRSASRFTSRRVRHLPRQRLHAAEGLALQRPAVPQRDPHGRHPTADPARRRRGVRRRPRRGRRLRPGAARPRHAAQRRDLRRRGRRPDRRGRRVHPRRHGRHARHPARPS